MTDLLSADTATSDASATRPSGVPEKFWDAKSQSLRTDALLKSYLELEKKLGSMIAPNDTQRLHQAIGVPPTPQDYCINCDHGYFSPSEDLNAQMHSAGFSQPQVQLVYDLAAQHLVPMIMDIANQYQAESELQRLQQEFGPDRWPEIARQLHTWANANLPQQAADGLSSTYDGVMALHQMMSSAVGQDALPPAHADSAPHAGAQDITAMMRDPRYWKKKDPRYVALVTAAFERKYGN